MALVAEVIRLTRWLYTIETVDDLLLKIVNETMKEIFSDAGTEIICDFLQNNCHLKPEEIPEKPEVFSNGLQKLLGSGAQVLEKLILKNLYSQLELKIEQKKNYRFSDCIKELKEGVVAKT